MPLLDTQLAVQAIVQVLDPLVLGQELPGWSSCCGTVKAATATAVKIQPADPGQETLWVKWKVEMRPKPNEPDWPWTCSLCNFLSQNELDRLFSEYFGVVPRVLSA